MRNETNVDLGTLPTILLVVFIVLKLCHVINWSWLWVLSPLWIMAIICFILFIIIKIIG